MLAGEKGLTVFEMIVTLGIIGILTGVAISSFGSKTLALSSATQDLMGALRVARANATGRGVHFRVTINADSYSTQRLQDPDGDGNWTPDGAAQQVDISNPAYISTGAGTAIEFDTRGLLMPPDDDTPASVITIKIENPENGGTKEIQVWPSGQIGQIADAT